MRCYNDVEVVPTHPEGEAAENSTPVAAPAAPAD